MSEPARSLLPANPEIEKALVGAVLLDPPALLRVGDIVQAGDFHHPAHAAVWAAAVELQAAREPVDPVSIAARMLAAGTINRLRAIGGEAYLAELLCEAVTSDSAPWYARQVRDLATRRRLIEASQALAAAARDDAREVADLVRDAQRLSLDVAARSARKRLITQEESIAAALSEVERAVAAREQGTSGPAIPTGFPLLDEALAGGLRPEYVILAGRPSMGKTSLLADLLEAGARFSGTPGLFLSAEMAHAALSMRRLAADSHTDAYRLRRGTLDNAALQAVSLAGTRLSPLPIWYDDTTIDVDDLCAVARRWRADPEQGGRGEHAIIGIDYLQRLRCRRIRDASNEVQRIGEISRCLKDLQRELGCVVIALSQLNRALETRDDKRPRLSDLRGSGDLEQDGDLIAFLYRPIVYHPKSDPHAAECIIAKGRASLVGTVPLGWEPTHTRFYHVDPDQPPLPAPEPRPHYTEDLDP